MTYEEVWVRFASAALADGCDAETAAQVADDMMLRYLDRLPLGKWFAERAPRDADKRPSDPDDRCPDCNGQHAWPDRCFGAGKGDSDTLDSHGCEHPGDSETFGILRAAQHAYDADPTADRYNAMVAAQRAYDAEREAQRREAIAAEAREDHLVLIARVTERLQRPIPDALDDAPVGLVSHARARNLMMAPAVAGGAIWVALDVPSALMPEQGRGDALLALGSVAIDPGDGWGWCVALSRRVVIEALRSDAPRLARIGLEAEVELLLSIVDRLEEMQS